MFAAVFPLAPSAIGQLPPLNDNFANAIQLIGTNVTAYATNTYATKEPGEPNHAGNGGGKSVWWYWQAPQAAYVTISTLGSTTTTGGVLDTTLGVYTGSSVSSLTEITSDDDGLVDYTSQIHFKATSGTVYRIAVDGYSGGFVAGDGRIVINLKFSTSLPIAPAWNLPDTSGSMVASTNFSGKVVLLNFWATWCGPCIAEMPDLVALEQKYAVDGLTIIGASVDNSVNGASPASLVSSFGASYGISYPLVMTRPLGYSVESAYGGIPYIPSSFIIDRENHIVDTFVGTQTYATFENAILPLLYSDLKANVTITGQQARIYWPTKQVAFHVESSGVPTGGEWTAVNAQVQSDGINQFVNVPLNTNKMFFRLRL